jgi:hypothetical protein
MAVVTIVIQNACSVHPSIVHPRVTNKRSAAKKNQSANIILADRLRLGKAGG